MSYQHSTLAAAIGWKFNNQSGMTTSDGYLTGWPRLPWPTDAEQAQYVSDYVAYLGSAQAKDDELQRFFDSPGGKVVCAMVLVGIDKGLWTLADLKAKYRSVP